MSLMKFKFNLNSIYLTVGGTENVVDANHDLIRAVEMAAVFKRLWVGASHTRFTHSRSFVCLIFLNLEIKI